jgi:hypothetical protein
MFGLHKKKIRIWGKKETKLETTNQFLGDPAPPPLPSPP